RTSPRSTTRTRRRAPRHPPPPANTGSGTPETPASHPPAEPAGPAGVAGAARAALPARVTEVWRPPHVLDAEIEEHVDDQREHDHRGPWNVLRRLRLVGIPRGGELLPFRRRTGQHQDDIVDASADAAPQ